MWIHSSLGHFFVCCCSSSGPPGWKLWAGGLEETEKRFIDAEHMECAGVREEAAGEFCGGR